MYHMPTTKNSGPHNAEASVAVITGGSMGLRLATVHALVDRGWAVAFDARRAEPLDAALAHLPADRVVGLRGDVTDAHHRAALADAARSLGRVSLLVNNASRLGPIPQPALSEYPLAALRTVFETNLVAPLALIQRLLPDLVRYAGTVISISSDAAVEAYPGWGGYGSSKAALDQLTAVLAAGDMRTELHQQAFPGQDISDRPEAASAVPALLRLLDSPPDGVRHRVTDLVSA
jgi:NAD(P)-dependent dehydrogenase (short-subunit alcohol dehydrogenase family)